MTPEEMEEMRDALRRECQRRAALGDYDVNASPIRACVETLYRIVDHLLGKETKLLPKRKKK